MNNSLKEHFVSTEIGLIPKDWEIKKLQQLAKVTGGKRLPKGNILSQHDTGHPYIRVSDMVERGISMQSLMYVPLDVVDNIKRYRIEEGDLYISVAGTLGLVGKVPKELDGANLTENADRISEIQCDRDFLLWVLRSELIQKTIKKEQTNNAQPKLALTRIKEFPIPIPPKFEQRKIAIILSSVDKAIEKTEAIIKQTEKLRQGLMQQILTKGIGHTKFQKTEIGEIPENWRIASVEEIFKEFRETTNNTETYPLFSLTIEHGLTPKTDRYERGFLLKDKDNNQYRIVKPNDILFNPMNLRFGAIAISKEKLSVCVSAYYNVLELKDKDCVASYYSYLFSSHLYKGLYERIATGSLIEKKRVHLSQFLKLKIPVPTKEEQEKIISVISSVEERLDKEKNEYSGLLKIKQGLMQSLLTGKVRVKVDETEVTQV